MLAKSGAMAVAMMCELELHLLLILQQLNHNHEKSLFVMPSFESLRLVNKSKITIRRFWLKPAFWSKTELLLAFIKNY